MANEGDSNVTTTVRAQGKWVKPEPNFLKANWDVAIDLHADFIGIDGVISNSQDDVKVYFYIPKAPAMTLEVAKALVLARPCCFASIYGLIE